MDQFGVRNKCARRLGLNCMGPTLFWQIDFGKLILANWFWQIELKIESPTLYNWKERMKMRKIAKFAFKTVWNKKSQDISDLLYVFSLPCIGSAASVVGFCKWKYILNEKTPCNPKVQSNDDYLHSQSVQAKTRKVYFTAFHYAWTILFLLNEMRGSGWCYGMTCPVSLGLGLEGVRIRRG